MFTAETKVEGKVICGKISDGKFHLNQLNPSNDLKPPMKPVTFTKEYLDITINELKQIRDKL